MSIDLVKASDAKIEAEANRLSAATQAQLARLEDARRAQRNAASSVAEAEKTIADLKAKVAASQEQIVETAIRAYVQPVGSDLRGTPQSSSSGDYARALTLTGYVQAQAADGLDELKAAKSDLSTAREQLVSEQAAAERRAKAEAVEAARLAKAEAAKQAAHRELQRRIDDLAAESRVLAAQESEFAALIQREAAANEAARARQLAERAAAARQQADRASRSAAPSPSVPRAEAAPSSAGGFMWPVRGPVTSEFGPRWGSFHSGMDIAPPSGTPIAAARDGIVVVAGPYGDYGNFVAIDHGNGLSTAYAHQARVIVSKGDEVRRGQIIGYVGNSGRSTGPHVHFEVRVNGSAQNPRAYVPGSP